VLAGPGRGILGRMVSRIEVAALPAEALLIPSDCYIVIDVIRATTTIATLFARGVGSLVVSDSLEQARIRAAAEGRLLFGEVGGLPPDDFDYGNSPSVAASLSLGGSTAMLYTTNGTTALCELAGNGATVIAGALANLTAVVSAAGAFETVTLVCAGGNRGTRFGLDDFAAAAAFIHPLVERFPSAELGDMALLASETKEIERLVLGSHHAGIIRGLGLARDLDFALTRDSSLAVPAVTAHGIGWALLEDAR